MNKKGFTLVEIIVVLVILAILAAIAVPSVLGYVEEAKKENVILGKLIPAGTGTDTYTHLTLTTICSV